MKEQVVINVNIKITCLNIINNRNIGIFTLFQTAIMMIFLTATYPIFEGLIIPEINF